MIYCRDGCSAVGTGLNEAGVPHTVTQQMEHEEISLFKPASIFFLRVDFTRILSRGHIYHLKQTSR